MRRLPIAFLLLATLVGACRRPVQVGSPPPAATTVPAGAGGATPREALQKFMTSAKVQDLDAMSNVWGTSQGPIRSTTSRQEWEQREVILMGCLKHDSYRVVSESPAAGGERVMVVELRFRDLTRSTNFYAVPGPEQRWFIRQFDIEPLQAICQRRA